MVIRRQNNANLKAMPSRRLSGASLLSAALEENDDDAEREMFAKQKRAEAERRAEKARSPFRETPGHQARTAQITDMYSDCITLCAENVRAPKPECPAFHPTSRPPAARVHPPRACTHFSPTRRARAPTALAHPPRVRPPRASTDLARTRSADPFGTALLRLQKVNEKNSWSLDLIDHMGRMIGDPSSGSTENNMTNFQLASSTLDAGVKIYAYRVDSVYTETFRLMGGLNRSGKRDPKADDDAESADEEVSF